MRKNNKKEDLKIYIDILNNLIKNNKVSFKFYNNNLLDLDLIQICYNTKEEIIELQFRDVMKEYIEELKQLTKNYNKINDKNKVKP